MNDNKSCDWDLGLMDLILWSFNELESYRLEFQSYYYYLIIIIRTGYRDNTPNVLDYINFTNLIKDCVEIEVCPQCVITGTQ